MKTRIIYGLLAGLFFGLYWLTWSGAVLFVAILAVYLFVYIIIGRLQHRDVKYLGIAGAVVVVGIGYVLLSGYPLPSLFTGPTALATSEMHSLNPLSALGNFSVLTLLIPVILALLVYRVVKQGDASTILLLVWSVVMLVMTLVYLRFACYFAVNVALLTGWFIWYTWRRLAKWNIQYAVIVTAILCLAVLVPNVQQATAIAGRARSVPSDAWCDTLTWVKDNTPQDSVILSWWDYGYWINRMADRKAYITPSQQADRITETACFFLSPSGASSIDFNYLILDYATTTSKFRGITIWAGLPVELYSLEYYQSLVVRLYQGEPVGQYALVYQSEQVIEGVPEVKVFYKRIIIDGQ